MLEFNTYEIGLIVELLRAAYQAEMDKSRAADNWQPDLKRIDALGRLHDIFDQLLTEMVAEQRSERPALRQMIDHLIDQFEATSGADEFTSIPMSRIDIIRDDFIHAMRPQPLPRLFPAPYLVTGLTDADMEALGLPPEASTAELVEKLSDADARNAMLNRLAARNGHALGIGAQNVELPPALEFKTSDQYKSLRDRWSNASSDDPSTVDQAPPEEK